MVYSRYMLCSLALLLICAGCSKRNNHHTNMKQEVDIPMTEESFCNVFDEELDEFTTELDVSEVADKKSDDSLYNFTWVEDTENADGFKTVYFGFDRHNIADDQREAFDHNVALIKSRLAENSDYALTIVAEGHADHAAGKDWYNMLISEKRAKRICDELVNAGIPQECIKVVGRGSEIPAIMNGEMVTGDRMEQAPNRRCEMRIIYA